MQEEFYHEESDRVRQTKIRWYWASCGCMNPWRCPPPISMFDEPVACRGMDPVRGRTVRDIHPEEEEAVGGRDLEGTHDLHDNMGDTTEDEDMVDAQESHSNLVVEGPVEGKLLCQVVEVVRVCLEEEGACLSHYDHTKSFLPVNLCLQQVLVLRPPRDFLTNS